MITKNIIVMMLFAATIAQPLAAQETLTLEQALSTALKNNLDIEVARNTADIAQNNAHPGKAGLLPSVDLTSIASYSDNESQTAVGPVTDASTTTLASIEANFTLFNGFSNIYTYKKLRSQNESGKLEARNTIEQIVVQIYQAYFHVANASENENLAMESLEISRERLQRAQNRSQFGQANNIDVLSAQVDFNADSVSYLNARLASDQARRNLRVLLNRDDEGDFAVETTVIFDRSYELQDLQNRAIDQNAAYRYFVRNVEQSKYDVKIANSAFLPQLTFSTSYDLSHKADNFNVTLDNANKGLSAGLNLRFNLFNGFQNKINRQNAKINLKNRQLTQDAALLDLKKSVADAFQSYQNSLFVLNVEQTNVQSAQLNFDRTQELYNLGQVTTTQFREAQLNLVRAKSSILSAQYDAKLNEIILLQLSGQLLI
ncbi:MAG: TolC family protein [Deferribacteres bacterium]|nr:TolC family protein [candidate division KSB1 bacterium]MCB9500577.1 TolC family protein [Deferribacteres bacterium]